ncbi:cytochrome C signal peptide protein [Pandoraea terrae]|uniref:Cytochrome C signal peptide protein n=1 Tax=Pandoraea terrae TaxID=1537710 RepID=A0A5E4ZHF0_9BURK|nr:c-type cytochrome [Pandoraea terrae]VVE59623.1 cytochrome C signal peptide protein [Pandoraea terrae]
MKKLILLAISVVVVVLLVVFGPSLLDLYRLQHFVTTSAEAYQADGGTWPRLTDVCLNCHGVKGNSLNQGFPSLAGQPAPYVAVQLHNFANGQRANPTMGPLAMTLSDVQITLLSDYYARQAVAENRFFEPDPKLRAKGEQLVTGGSCAACHGARLMGHDQFPRLAGQGYDYILKQLDAFAAGTRSEATGTMKSIAAATSPEDRKAIANYLASLDPEKK